jgi:adenylate cyclase
VIVSLVAGSLLAGHLCFWAAPGVFETWNARTLDRLFHLRTAHPRLTPAYDDTIVHVDLNDSSVRALAASYLNRSHFADVVRNLTQMGVVAQVFDFIFAAPTGIAEDAALVGATAQAGTIYFGAAFRWGEAGSPGPVAAQDQAYLDRTKWRIRVEGDPASVPALVAPLLTFPELASRSRGLGFLNVEPDPDGVYRRIMLLARFGDGYFPSLAFRAICDYLHVDPSEIVLEPGRAVTLKNVRRKGATTPSDIVIPIDWQGRMIINFIGPWESMKHYSFADVWRAAESRDELDRWRDELNGKVVVVSETTTGSADVGPAPTDPRLPLAAVHANAMHTILTGAFMREVTGLRMFALELLLAAILVAMAVAVSARWFTAAALTVGVMYVAGAATAFLWQGLLLNIVRPPLVLTLAAGSILAYRYIVEEKQRAVLRRSFEAYFPPKLVERIIDNPALVTSTGEEKELTILFSDIRGFTGRSRTMSAEQVQRFLNTYFDAMVGAVFRHDGTVDKFIGDGLMAFYGHPDLQPDHALRAVRTAIDMQARVEELNESWLREDQPPIQIRIGINTGHVIVGNMGSAQRLSYTVVGAPVNLAQRLEANAPPGRILLSDRTNELVRGHIPTVGTGEIDVKGVGPINVYVVEMSHTRESIHSRHQGRPA